jgi:hypothetical protein
LPFSYPFKGLGYTLADCPVSWDHFSDPDNVVTTRMPDSYAWYDMSVGFRALIIAFFVDRIHGFELQLDSDRQALLDKLVEKHIANLSSPECFSLNNHGMFQAQGLMGLLQTAGWAETAADKVDYALHLMEKLVTSQFHTSGIHNEHSPHYHFYVLATFEAVTKSGWYESSQIITERVASARDAQKWLVDPHKRPICVGDSILTAQKRVKFPENPDEGFVTSDFDSVGYSVLRSNWGVPAETASMVFLMGAYHSKTHKHRDCLSFDWFDQGDRIICDGGKYGYMSDKYRHYALSYRAHNAAEIEGFDVIKTKPYGSIIEPIEALPGGIYKMRGKLDYPAIKQDRNLYVKPGKWLIVADQLGYARARGTTLWFHLAPDYRLVTAKGTGFRATGDKERSLLVTCMGKDISMELHCGNEADMKGFVSSKDYEISPALTAAYTFHGDSHVVHTLFCLDATAHEEAQRFAVEQLGATESTSASSDTEPAPRPAPLVAKPGNLLPNIQHHKYASLEDLKLHFGAKTYTVETAGVPINFFCDRKASNPGRLLIMLPGASARKRGHIDFQRHGWAEDFPDHDVVAFSDPSLKADNSLGLAWFQNAPEAYGIDAVVELAKGLIKAGGYAEEDVAFFGSSGGGFTVLQMAKSFAKSPVIAINPQIYLYNYSWNHYKAMLDACYPGLSEEEVKATYNERITVQLDPGKRSAPVYVFQNTQDVSHLEMHLKPFTESLDASLVATFEERPKAPLKPFNVVLFDDPASGHAPPTREVTVGMLLPLLSPA